MITKYVAKTTNLLRRVTNINRCQARRMLTVYGIETNEGIYEIKKRTSGNTTKGEPSSLPLLLTHEKCIEVYSSAGGGGDIIDELLTLQNLEGRLHGASGQCQAVKGYSIDGRYRPAIVQFTNKQGKPSLPASKQLKKTVFQWSDVGTLQLVSGADERTGDVYEINKFNGVHQLFSTGSKFIPVYKTFEQTRENLLKLCEGHNSISLKELSNTMLKHAPTIDHTPKQPFIVIEGLDGTGKSTMTQNLGKYLNAQILGTPPDSIKHIRKEFDGFPELCRRSFYAYSNYLAAQEIGQVLKEKPVVLDRYWHSTTAYAIAKHATTGVEEHIPPCGSDIYTWPKDLLKPSAVVFLTTREKERDERMNIRDETTAEEDEMRNSKMFRKRILEAYRRIGLEDAWIEVDTDGTQEQSLQKAISGLKNAAVL